MPDDVARLLGRFGDVPEVGKLFRVSPTFLSEEENTLKKSLSQSNPPPKEDP